MPASISRSQRSSSSVGSASSAFLDKLEAEASGADILDNSSALQAGIFGVLFTVTKEKYNTGWRFLLFKLVLDYLQLFTLTFSDAEPWVFDDKNVIWKVVQVVNIDNVVAPLGYSFFIALLYIMISGLVLTVGLSLWVAWCFKSRSFPYVWPIKVLRVYANLFFQVLDVLTLTLFQVPFNCRIIGYDKSVFNHLANYPGVVCSSFPHVVHMVTSGFSLAVFVLCALLDLGADFELSPLQKGLLSVANGEVEVQAFVIKFAMTFVCYAIGWQKVRLMLTLILSFALTYVYLRWSPHLVAWVNHVRVGLYTSILLSSALAVVLVYGPAGPPEAVDAHRHRITTLLWALLGPAALLGAAVSYVRLDVWSAYVLRRFREAPPGEKARRIYKFSDPREVEIVSRVCRKWTDQHKEILDRKAVKEGEIIIKAGLQLFPGRCYMLIMYSNYLIDVLDNSQTGYSQMAAAKQAGPGWMQRFAIFAREQEQLQRLASARGGEGGVDLVSYVEYQKNWRLVIRAHKDALIATRTFWQALLHHQVKFTALASALNEIERTVLKAEAAYKLVMGRYPTNPKLARTYARFLENVVNDPWKAARYYAIAERLTEQQEADEAAGAEMAIGGGDGGDAAGVESRLLHRVDERVNAVFIINANGIIQMANKNACSLLGYGKGELDGKNINVIMPPPFSQRHNKYVRHYVHTGREGILNTVACLPALHKERHVLLVRVGVTKVSGAAESSTFMGVLEPVPRERNEAAVFLLPGGTVAAMDRAFVDWFAKQLDDCIAQHLADLAADEASATIIREAIERATAASKSAAAAAAASATTAATPASGRNSTTLNDAGAAADAAASEAAATADPSTNAHPSTSPPLTILLRHKYSRPVRVSLRLSNVGIGAESLLCATLTRTDPPEPLILVDGRGRIGFITGELAEALGATPEGLMHQPIADLLPQPWNALHAGGGGGAGVGWVRDAEASMQHVGGEMHGDFGGVPPAAAAAAAGAAAGDGSAAAAPAAQLHHHTSLQHHNKLYEHIHAHYQHIRASLDDQHRHHHRHHHSHHGHHGHGGMGHGGVIGGTAAAPPGSCLGGATIILGSSSKVQDYYKIEVSARGESDTGQPLRVVSVRRSSLAAALDERRLAVVVDAATGTVLEAGDSPQALFGFKPSALVGRNIADVVSALRPTSRGDGSDNGEGDGALPLEPLQQQHHALSTAAPSAAAEGKAAAAALSTPQLLCQLAAVSLTMGGTSWRVGVRPPMDERNLESLGVLRAAFLARQTRAAVLEVDVLVPGGAAEEADVVGCGPLAAMPGAPDDGGAAADGRSGSMLGGPTFKELHDRGQLSVSAAASIEAGLTALTSAPAGGDGGGVGAGGGGPGSAGAEVAEGAGSAAAGLRLRLNLWRADVLSGVLEVDGGGEVVAVSHAKLHQAGLMFGLNTAQLPRMRLSRLLQLPPHAGSSATAALYQQLQSAVPGAAVNSNTGAAAAADAKAGGGGGGTVAVRGALKGSGKSQRVGPLQLLTGHHADGQALELSVQAVVKDGAPGRSFVFVKLRSPVKPGDQASLLRALEAVAPKRLLRGRHGRRGSALAPPLLPALAAPVAAAAPAAPSLAAHASPRDAVPPLPLSPPPQPAAAAVAAAPQQKGTTPRQDGHGHKPGAGGADGEVHDALCAEDSVMHLEAGEAVGTGTEAAAPASARTAPEKPTVATASGTEVQPESETVPKAGLRGPAMLGTESEGDGETDVGGDASSGIPDNPVPAASGHRARFAVLGGSKDSDDVLIAGAVKYGDAPPPPPMLSPRAAAAAAATAAGAGAVALRPSATSMLTNVDSAVAQSSGADGAGSGAAADGGAAEDASESNESTAESLARGPDGSDRNSAEDGANGGYRSVASSTSSESSDSNRGRSGLRRHHSGSAQDSGGRERRHGAGGGGGTGSGSGSAPPHRKRRSSVSAQPTTAGSRRVVLNTPSARLRAADGGENAAAGGSPSRPSSPPPVGRGSRRALSSPPGSRGGTGRHASDALGAASGEAAAAFGSVSSPVRGRRGDGADAAAPGGLFPELRSEAGEGRAVGSFGGGMPPMDDPDEMNSQGSAMDSAMDDDIGGGGHQADYRRGKRFKKLASMLGSPTVQQAARDFRWQALLANLAQVVSNLISFVVLTLLLRAQVDSVNSMTFTAVGLRNAHELFINMALLDNMHRGLLPASGWYTNASLAATAAGMPELLASFSEHHSKAYLGSGTGRVDTAQPYNPRSLAHAWNYPVRHVMEYYSVDPPRVELRSMSLWEVGTRIAERALEVHHTHTALAAATLAHPAAALAAPVSNPAAPSNGDPFTDLLASRHLAGAYMTVANGTDGGLNATAAAAAEAAAAAAAEAGVAAASLQPGVSWTDAWRFVMSAGPTQLNEGYTDTLLSLVDQAVRDSNAINRVQLILMMVEGCAVATLLLVYMWWLQHRVTQQRYRVYGVFLAVPVGMIRALASRTITISQGSDSEEDSDDDEYHYQNAHAMASAQPVMMRQVSVGGASASGGSFSATPLRSLVSGLGLSRLLSLNSGGMNGGRQGSRNGMRKGSRRRLVRNSRDSLILLIPFVAWGITICIIYATGYYYLNQVQAPVNLLSVIDSSDVSIHRLLLYSLLAASEQAPAARAMLRGLLAKELSNFKLQWDVTLYGINTTTSELDARFTRIRSGVSFLQAGMADVLFRQPRCNTFGWEDVTCPAPGDLFYAASSHGLSYMVDRLVEDVEGLLAAPLQDANINSTRLEYIMTMGQGPLEAALSVVHDSTVTVVDSYYRRVDQLHVAAMVLSWVLVLFFVLCMLRPFLRRNRGETTRIAKMLSQLPADVDIEGLVFRLLLGPPALRRRNRRASVSSLIAEDPVLQAKLAAAEAQAERMASAGGGGGYEGGYRRFSTGDTAGGSLRGGRRYSNTLGLEGEGGLGRSPSRRGTGEGYGGCDLGPFSPASAAAGAGLGGGARDGTPPGTSPLKGSGGDGSGDGYTFSAGTAAAIAPKGFPLSLPPRSPSGLGTGDGEGGNKGRVKGAWV